MGALANIDPGDERVEYDLPDYVVVPDWDCIHRGECPYPSSTNSTNSSTETIEEIEEEIAEIEEEIEEIETESSYILVESLLNWADADAYCASEYDTSLASIHSSAQDQEA